MAQTIDPTAGSYRARWASIAIRENLAAIQLAIPSLPNDVGRNRLVGIKGSLYNGSDSTKPLKVGIIGAGCAGLFTALIFDHFKQECGLDIEYEILEANSEDRLGGRLFTYHFKDADADKPEPHNYYDVGAMRFPKIDIMDRTFDLFEKVCHMKENLGPIPAKGDLIKYWMEGKNDPALYNDVHVIQQEGQKITAKSFNITNLPKEVEDTTAADLIDREISIFTKEFHRDRTAGWELLMTLGDQYSVRQFLGQKYDYNTLEWLETFSYGNRWYDQAFSEMVLEDLDFNHDKPWRCVEGGSQEVAKRMRDEIKKKDSITFSKNVTAMTLIDQDGDGRLGGGGDAVDVYIKGEEAPRRYDAVFNSAPLGAMQRMNLSGLKLNWGTKQAIRSLGYGASCKVGIRFKNLWWIKHLNIKGGVAKTDLPLRVCVYPSYNLEDNVDEPGVLLVSYTWSQEAQRVASLINRHSPAGEEELKHLLIDNLARLHAETDNLEDQKRIKHIISESYITHHAYDWYSDPTTAGAFAYFGPAQFRNMYPWITRTNGKHIIIGEAASAHHAWVVGALESAVRGVYQFLFKHSEHSKAVDDALQRYNDNKVDSPFGPLPFEYDRAEDVAYMKSQENESVASYGEWAREQVVFETLRVKQGGDQLDCEKVTEAQLAPFIEVPA